MKTIIISLLLTIAVTNLAITSDWQFITSRKNSNGIEANYFIDFEESSNINGVKGYRERIVYTRGEYLEKIGIIEKYGYFDCSNTNYVEKKISFQDANGNFLKGYQYNDEDYIWKPVTPGLKETMLRLVCNY